MKIWLAILSIAVLGCQSKKQASEQGESQSFASKIELLTLEGAEIPIESDKITILNLWATWCGPCVKEMPDLEQMQAELPHEFQLILASDEGQEKIQAFVDSRDLDLTFAQLKTSMASLGAYSLPTTLIIGKNGELLESLVGARKWDSPEQIEELKNYLK